MFERIETLERIGERAPDVFGRIILVDSGVPPVRAYLHNSGFEDAFGFGEEKFRYAVASAKSHLAETLATGSGFVSDADYIFAMMYGVDGFKMIDLLPWKGLEGWPGNPVMGSFVFENGVYTPDTDVTCGNGIFVMGKEEEYRTSPGCKNLDYFMKNPPEIERLESRNISRGSSLVE